MVDSSRSKKVQDSATNRVVDENYTIAKCSTGRSRTIMRIFIKDSGIRFSTGFIATKNSAAKQGIKPEDRKIMQSNIDFKFSYKNGKFNFYKMVKNDDGRWMVRICMPLLLENQMFHFVRIKDAEGKPVSEDYADWFDEEPEVHLRETVASARISARGNAYGNKKRTHNKVMGLCVTQKKRLYRHLKKFLKSKNVDIKYLSKDPIVLMHQLCYPGLQADNELRRASFSAKFGSLVKEDMCKTTLKTNGSKTRNALFDFLKYDGITVTEDVQKHIDERAKDIYGGISYNIGSRLFNVRCLRKAFGYDLAFNAVKQKSMFARIEIANTQGVFQIREGRAPSLRQLESAAISMLKRFTINQMKKIIATTQVAYEFTDTIRLISEIERIRGCTYEIPQFETTAQLHERVNAAYIRLIPQEPAMINSAPTTYKNVEFTPLEKSMKICEEFNSKCYSHTMKCPKDRDELVSWTQTMSNCVGSYWSSIENHTYAMFGFINNETNDCEYNLGLNVNKTFNNTTVTAVPTYKDELKFSFAQFYGKRNQKVPDEHPIRIALMEVLSNNNVFSDDWTNMFVEAIRAPVMPQVAERFIEIAEAADAMLAGPIEEGEDLE